MPLRLILLALLIGGCRNEREVLTRTVTDSAGVVIISLPADDSTIPERPLDLDHPRFVLGGMDDTAGTFEYVRSLVVLPDGRMVVSTDDEWRLHVLDSLGRDIGRFGRRGEGPGEYTDAPALWRLGDSLLAIVSRRGVTVTVLDSDLAAVRRYSYRATGEYDSDHGLVGVTADGSTLTRYGRAKDTGTGPYRARQWISRVGPDGTEEARILEPVGDERFGLGGNRSTFVAFGRMTSATMSGDLVFVGTNDGFVIDGHDTDGTLRRSIRIIAPEIRITAAERDRYALEMREDAHPELAPFIDMMVRDLRYADVLRWHDALYPTADGGLWIERARLSNRDPRHMLVLDSTASLAARWILPADATPQWIGSDRALIRWRDADSVRAYVMVELPKWSG